MLLQRFTKSFLILVILASLLNLSLPGKIARAQSAGLKVQYRAADTNATDNQIRPHFNIVNQGTSAVSLSELKIRYWFTREGTADQNFWCDWATTPGSCSNVTGAFVQVNPARPGADFYLEVGFVSAAGSLAAGSQSGEIQTRISKSDWSNYNEAGDYSFDPTKIAFADWTQVTLYRNGVLVWGSEPGGTPVPTATPTSTQPGPTNTPTFTNTPGIPTSTPTARASPSPTGTMSRTPTQLPSGALQAENASFGGGAVTETTNGGFNGSGYINFPSSGGFLQFNNVDGGSGGNRSLQFRYALASGTRTGLLIVNGASQSITFNSSGTWTTWATHTVNVSLNAGTNNTVRLESNGQDLANIDELTVGAGGPTPTPTNTPIITPTRTPTRQPGSGLQMERLNRGLVRVNQSGGNFISWRLLGTDPAGIAFNVYQGATRLNSSPITNSTNFFHSGGSSGSTYTVRPVINGQEGADSEPSLNISSGGFLSVPLQIPAGGTTPDGVSYTYSANDASVGDLDGDGQYEIVLKWDPSNSKDNSQSGYTGNVYVDAYRLNGTRLWRIDLGRNIRAGAHYTQFQVYDYDGDGRAEVAMKTADATVSGTGQVIGNANADYRNSSGYILSGPEYLTVFNGQTGAVLATANYEPPRGTVSSWGDSNGNRVDRFLAGTAYLDGQRPSMIFARGYYTRAVIVAWDWRNGQLTRRWTFDSNVSGSQYTAQGNHQLSIADVDADGRQEIIYGAFALNDNGQPMWNTGYGHGDALHVGDFLPGRAGLEVFKIDEDGNKPTDWMADARTGQIIWSHAATGADNGRGVCDDIWAGSPGAEAWSSTVSGLSNTQSQNIGRKPSSANFLIWWDADPVRELLDSNHIDKYGTSGDTRLLTASGVSSNNGTKSTPALTADLFGDWREEVIWRASDSSALRIYTTTAVTSLRIFTLMHDAQYRVAIAWQNTAYNQPPHPSFFLGDGMSVPPQPTIYVP